MTDDRPDPPGDERAHEGTPGDPGLDPGREAALRRLLADARETGPPPPEVTARLDDALAALGRGEEPTGGPAPVVPLRRRRVRRALLAAGAVAATVVVAVPVTMEITGQRDDGSPTSAVEGTSEGAPDAADQGSPGASASSRPPSSGPSPRKWPPRHGPPGDGRPGLLQHLAPRQKAPTAESDAARGQVGVSSGRELLLSPSDFDEQVTALVQDGGWGPAPQARCGAPHQGRAIAVRYDGALGALRLVPGENAVRAQLYVCGRDGIVRARAVQLR